MSEGSNDDVPEGFRVPIHQSLTRPLMLGGVPRTLAILNWTFCVALSLPLRTWYAIPLSFFLHAVFYRAAKRDPEFWDVFRRAIRSKVFYRA